MSKKYSEYSEITALSGTDLLLVSHDNGNDTFTTKKVKVSNLPGTTSNTVAFTEDFAIDTTLNGKTVSNYGATTDIKGTFASDLPDGFSVKVVNEVADGKLTSSTKLMLHANGNTTTFTDSSLIGNTVTANGGATQSATQSKFGGKSAYFDGASDWLAIADSDNFNFGSGDFAIACWVYRASATNDDRVCGQGNTSNADYNFELWISTAGKLCFLYSTAVDGSTWDNSGDYTGSATIGATTWTHIAVIRNSTTIKTYINGQEDKSWTIGTSSMHDSAGEVWVGSSHYGPHTLNFNGYIDELRIDKGATSLSKLYPQTAEYYYGSMITLSPPSGGQLPGTSAINRNLASSAKGDVIDLFTTNHNIMAKSYAPAAANWVDTAQ